VSALGAVGAPCQAEFVLLLDVASTSLNVGGTSSRSTRLRTSPSCCVARTRPEQVAIIVSWLSGELCQRQIGVGWASLRSRPQAAAEPSLTVAGVNAIFTEIGALSGKGSQARRAELIGGCSPQPPKPSRPFWCGYSAANCARVRWPGSCPTPWPSGRYSRGRGAACRDAGRRSAGGSGGQLAAGLSGGAAALEAFTLRVGRPVGPMWHRPPPVWPMRSNAMAAQQFSRRN